MKRLFLTLVLLVGLCAFVSASNHTLLSPDGRLRLEVKVDKGLSFNLLLDDLKVVERVDLAMQLSDRILGEQPILRSVKQGVVDRVIDRVNPTKNSTVRENYRLMTLNFKGKYSVEFRLYDDGAAYRFVTQLPGQIDVISERCDISFPSNSLAHLSLTNNFRSMYEEPYTRLALSEYAPDNRMSYLPVLVELTNGPKVLFSDADVRDYPCQFLRGDGSSGFTSHFPREPKELEQEWDRSLKIISEHEYIARTQGTRTFPWRMAIVAREDADLIRTELAYLLAEPTAEGDWSWVRPGLVSWDWWNGMRLTGVDFRAGCNTESYLCYIDFASKYGIPYIIMDEGWSRSTSDVLEPNPNLDLQKVIAYGRERNVEVVLWLQWLVVERDMERIFATYAAWGIPGLKIDFMDRSDQTMVNYYERVMKCAAKHRLFVDMHGSYTPKGLQRTYPNFLNYEAVLGLEQGGRCKPENSNYLPFIRGVVGPMDFTPGSMFSAQPEDNRSTGANPMGSGTRAYQMALYVLFESPIQMLADNPQLYEREAICTKFISSVPTTWDELRVLRAVCGHEVVVARRKGSKWFIGGITSDRPYSTELSLDFLPAGKFKITYFEDGVNADRQAMDYRRSEREVDASTKLPIKMVRNGGWAAVIE